MKLPLTRIHSNVVSGIYGVNAHVCDDDFKDGKPGPNYGKWSLIVPGGCPDRFRALEPEAAIDFIRMTEAMRARCGYLVVVSDMFRSPESSLKASLEPKRSAKPPGESGHNYGESIDIHVEAMMSLLGFKTKRELDAWMAQFNWFCFWTDGRGGREWWHYNHIPPRFRDKSGGFTGVRTSGYLELMIRKRYGDQMRLSVAECQVALNALKFECGDPDGKIGKLTRRALAGFQSHWMPKRQSGAFDEGTQWLLAYLTCEIVWVPLPAEMPPIGVAA